MSSISSPKLTLTRNGSQVTVKVTYHVEFNPIERFLSGLGMRFIERIAVIGVDPPGATTGTVLKEFDGQFIKVESEGIGTFPVNRKREIILDRTVLDEDSHPFLAPDVDADEIRCRIRIEAIGLPPAVTPDKFTDQQVLGGLVNFPVAGAAQA